ncbi:MFS transporter [Rhizobium pusense]|uniref:MFS transporter n=1 Tax=Agrobacterium pusense TaxID=648995 RepID=UPI001FCD4C84|nr:MFS transporter [Agrobacterium pusense]MCJ2877411.1 MFS transporter [Agrobacterium pusense]
MQHAEAGTRHGLLLIAVAWLAPIGSTLFAPVLPSIIAHFAAVPHAELLAPIAMVTPALMVALLAPVAGLLTDRFGRRRVLLVALGLYAATGIAPYWIDNLHLIIASRALVGIAEAGVMTASTALICDYFTGEKRAHWLSVQFGSASLVATVCFALAGFLGGYNWRAPFIIYGTMVVFIPLVLLIIFEPARRSAHEGAAVIPADRAQGAFSSRFLIGLFMTLVSGILFCVTPVHISLVLSERGFTAPTTLGLASAFGSIGLVAGAALFRFQSKRPIGILLSAAMLTQSVGYVVLYTQPSLAGGILGMFINNAGCGISLPLVLAFTMGKLPDAFRGRASGLWTSAFFIGQFVCPLVVAGINAAAGGMVGVMGVLACFTAVAGFGLVGCLLASVTMREAATPDGRSMIIH